LGAEAIICGSGANQPLALPSFHTEAGSLINAKHSLVIHHFSFAP
jgi:hypothetical protein